MEREEGARVGRLQGPAARGGLAGGRGQARGASALAVLAAHAAHATNAGHAGHAGHAEQAALAAHAVQAAHATRDRGVPVASGTQRGRHARAPAQAFDEREEGKREKARGKALEAKISV